MNSALGPASGHAEFRVERSVIVLRQNGASNGDPLPLLELARRPASVVLIGDLDMGKSTALSEIGAHIYGNRISAGSVTRFCATRCLG